MPEPSSDRHIELEPEQQIELIPEQLTKPKQTVKKYHKRIRKNKNKNNESEPVKDDDVKKNEVEPIKKSNSNHKLVEVIRKDGRVKQGAKPVWHGRNKPWDKKRLASEQRWALVCAAQKKLLQEFPGPRYSHLSPETYAAVFRRNIKSLAKGPDYFKLSVDNFDDPLTTLLEAEEAHDHTEMRKFDLRGVKLRVWQSNDGSKSGYQCFVAGLAKGEPSVIPTDGLVIHDGTSRFRMVIEDILGDIMAFSQVGQDVGKGLDLANKKFDISFVPSGLPYVRYRLALNSIKKNPKLNKMIFGAFIDQCLEVKIDPSESSTDDLESRINKCNPRQKQAVINILEARCRPNLYVIFGPPGTGKTFTVVETVIQIHKRNKKARILVCAGSNLCVDGIAKNIADARAIKSFVRLSSKFHYYSGGRMPDYFTTDARKIYGYKVILTTNMMASRLAKVRFDYIFIDEAGHSHVPESLIPITRLGDDGCLVLAGDPKQLGPVIKSFEVERLGLGISLLERVCALETYERNREGSYNERYITKLVESYRCDDRILGLCNELFYQGDLACLGKTPQSMLNILGYPKPMIFAKVKGTEMTPPNGTSRCNRVEAKACIKFLFHLYKMGLEPHQIGIITPYVYQKTILQDEFIQRLKQDRFVLDNRFKLPTVASEKESKPAKEKKNSADAKPTQPAVNDIDALTAALSKMRMLATNGQSKREDVSGQLASRKLAPKMDWQCKIDTVDAFQGSEREVILVSTVRTPVDGSIEQCGFLANPKRFNVTISRAKWLVVVVGHPEVLNCCEYWKKFGENSTHVVLRNFM